MFGKKPTQPQNSLPGGNPADSGPVPAPSPAGEPAASLQKAGTVSSAGPTPPSPPGKDLVALQNEATGRAVGLVETMRQADEALALLRYRDGKLETADYARAKQIVIEELLDRVDFKALDKIGKDAQKTKIREITEGFTATLQVPLNAAQLQLLKQHVVDEVLGFGPLEPLLADPDVADIMVNTHKSVYIEKKGKIYHTDVVFASEKHLLSIIQKVVSLVGRRIDENSPMVDARMPDGSRFNAIIQPLALDGGLVSIRKFKKNKMPLTQYVELGSMSERMCTFLEICAEIRLNILISGGTGSGKTTLLNALSGHIGMGERVITIEDAAELQLQQPHVLRLETRPSNSEGAGEITQRQLVRNALRMRPDRIILGEIRGDEVIDVLAAMNTGHEGSMATIHSNSPRDCLTRLENLVGLSGISLPLGTVRHQVASALHMIVQIARMRDGRRRITQIEEIVGMEGDMITTQTLFQFRPGPMGPDGVLTGNYECSHIRPRFLSQAAYFGREKELVDCLSQGS